MKCGNSSTHYEIIIVNSKLKLIGKQAVNFTVIFYFHLSYKKKVREYQTDFEQQKSINDLKKTKEEEAMQKINLIEGELLMSNKKPDLTNRNRSEISCYSL